jgi:hypothetical protein
MADVAAKEVQRLSDEVIMTHRRDVSNQLWKQNIFCVYQNILRLKHCCVFNCGGICLV